ncbi:cardiac-enriched FHL2-interacting protein [Erythrolamprus reginae]|uniref:cardiac-enriched FHL2-interacting protein n=1 Tax=Erythrolamprus reginae TaxID=121349 RepID=UPI00396C3518
MQGNRKQADGQSDSSSLGSLLDDTDREVCSLTDRAFKSLCVAEQLQAPFAEADPAVGPPGIAHQFSGKLFPGPWNYALRKNTGFHKQLSRKEHATFLLSKTHEDKNYSIVNPSIRRRLDLPLPDLHNCTHISKVSSLIKTFDKVDSQVSLLIARQPGDGSLTESPLICGDDVAFWRDKRILNIQPGISGLPDPCPSDKRKGYGHIDLVYQGLPVSQANVSDTPRFSISSRTVRTRSGRAREEVCKGSFLHSENSAFESWNAYHKKVIGMGETMPPMDGSLGYFEETPFFKKTCISEPRPIGAFVLGGSFSDDPSPKSLSKASLSSVPLAEVYFPSPADAKRTAAQQRLPQGLAPVDESSSPTSLTSSRLFLSRISPSSVPMPRAPVPPSSPFPQISLPPEALFHSTDTQAAPMPHVTELAEKTTKPEFALRVECGSPPPWRKQKTTLSRMKLAEVRAAKGLEIKDSPYRKSPEVARLVGTAAPESRVILSDPPFSLSALLTPVPPLEPKNEGPSPGNRLLVVTPFLLEAGAGREAEERAFYSQNDYKSKAPRLLFNLKDIRKRVKSTYSPSPLLRALEEKSKVKEHLKATVVAAHVLEESSKEILGGADKVNIFEQMDYIQEKDNFASLNENFISDGVLLSLSKSRAGILKYQNKNHSRQSGSIYTEDIEMVSAHEQKSKVQPTPSPKPHPTDVVQQEALQEHNHKKVPSGQGVDEASRNLFYPAEENTSDRGTCCSAGSDHKGKRSPSQQPFHEGPSSLMQLFQKACLQESRRGKDHVDGREEEEESSKEEEENEAVDETDQGKRGKENVAVLKEKEDREPQSKPGEPLTPTLSSVLKPTLFMIKDNTFKSPPVTRAIKLPLLRSLSCEGATPVPQENPRNAEEDGWGSLQGGNDGGSQVADKSSLTTNCSFSEGLAHLPVTADSEETGGFSVLPEKELKSPEKLAISKEKVRIRKLRSSSAVQPNLGFESELRHSEERSPVRERMHDTKNQALTRHRGGPCVKKIISQEGRSSTVAEDHPSSPVSSEAFGYASSPLSNSAGSALQSPRSDSVGPSVPTGPLSATTANVNIMEAEKAAHYPLCKATGSLGRLPITPTFDPEPAAQLPGDAGSPLGANERLQLVSQMGRTAAKPPTVPPKTEKALRRAKKLASRRKKMEAQQKKVQDETFAQSEDASALWSLACPDSPLSAPKYDPMKPQPLPSMSPTPSLPTTQRKLLQDPDSGEFFIVDLPLRLKMFYDPESGRYVQVPAPSSQRSWSQTPSSEMSFPPCAWGGPSTLPPRVASVPALLSSTQLPETFALKASGPVSEQPAGAVSLGPLEGPPGPESALLDVHSPKADGSPSNFEKDVSTSAATEDVSMGSAEESAVEGLS